MELTVLGQQADVNHEAESGCSSSGCGSDTDALSHLPDEIREKVHNHPCYSEEAHHHYARMHVAVAPACNIQCHYCNRKYDCSNESRPGVVSELLDPDAAVKKVMAVAAEVPHNAAMGVRAIRRHCKLDGAGERLLEQAMQHFGLSARAHDRIRKVARTIADLDGAETITATYLSEAIQYRTLDRQL